MLNTKNKPLHLLVGAASTFNLLMLKLLFKRPENAKTFPGRIYREYMSLVGKEQWESKDLFDILPIPPGTRITLEHLPGHGVGTPVDELAYLALVTAAVQPQRVFEIGTYRGRTALNFALNSPPEAQIFTLDLPPEAKATPSLATYRTDAVMIHDSRPQAEYQGKDVAGKITQLYGDSRTFDFSPYYGQMDLIFVDGAHDYAAVCSDTRQAVKLRSARGVILWHDFANFGDYNDVTRAILDTLGPGRVMQIANTQLAILRPERN